MSDQHEAPWRVGAGAQSATATAEPQAGMLAPIRETGLAPISRGRCREAWPRLGRSLGRRHRLQAGLARLPPPLDCGHGPGDDVLGRLAGILTFLFLPRGFEAVAWLRVRDKSGMYGSGIGRDNAEYEAYRKTQVQLIKSPLVLMAALRRPGINPPSTCWPASKTRSAG